MAGDRVTEVLAPMIGKQRILHRSTRRGWQLAMFAGLTLVGLRNWRQWHSDEVAIAQILPESPVPNPQTWPGCPRVSVLVAAWNEAPRIDEHIQSFLALRYPSIELILCAGGADGTFERASAYAGERVVIIEQRPGEGKQRALVKCFDHATGEVMYFTDADCVYRDEALINLLQPIVVDGEHAATGTSRPLDSQQDRLLARHIWAADVASASRNGRYVEGLLGRNAAITRSAIERIGGLDFTAPTGTDYHLARRLIAHDIPIRYVRSSVVPSAYPETFGDYRKRQSRWLRNLLLYGPQYGATRDVAATRRTVIIGALMILTPVAGSKIGPLPWLIWSMLLAHATLARVRYMTFASRIEGTSTPRIYPLAAPFLALLDFLVWALPVLDLASPRRRHQW